MAWNKKKQVAENGPGDTEYYRITLTQEAQN